MISIYNLEDYKIIRDGIKYLISQESGFRWVGDSNDPEHLFQTLSKETVDVLVLDIYLDGMQEVKILDGFEICKYVKGNYPHTRVLAHSMYEDSDKVMKMLDAGASGYISKRSGYDYLVEGIKVVAANGTYICKEVARNFKNAQEYIAGRTQELKPKHEFFSRREKEVLELMAKGFSSKDIAKQLFITEKTVESHRRNMVQKAKARNTMELISMAINRGVIKI